MELAHEGMGARSRDSEAGQHSGALARREQRGEAAAEGECGPEVTLPGDGGCRLCGETGCDGALASTGRVAAACPSPRKGQCLGTEGPVT